MIDFIVANSAITDAECQAYQTPKKVCSCSYIFFVVIVCYYSTNRVLMMTFRLPNYGFNPCYFDIQISHFVFSDLCDNVLNLVTTTVDGMHEVLCMSLALLTSTKFILTKRLLRLFLLGPYLFESLVKPELSGALGIVCKCLA